MQFVYDRWAKEKGHEIRKLIIASLGYVERSTAGALAVMFAVNHMDWTILLLISCWTFMVGLMFLAAYWWAEDIYITGSTAKDEKFPLIEYGQNIKKLSTMGLNVIGIIMVYIYSHGVFRHSLPMAILGIVGGVVLIRFGEVTVLRRSRRCLGEWGRDSDQTVNPEARWSVLLVILFAAAAWIVLDSLLVHARDDLAFWAILIAVFLAVLYERMPYEEISMMYVKEYLLGVGRLGDQLLFGSSRFQ